MAEWLVVQGHQVTIITAVPFYPAWKRASDYSACSYRKETIHGVTVWRCPLYVPNQASGWRRILHLLTFGLSSFPIILSRIFSRPDVVFLVEPPLVCAPAAWLLARLSRAKAWLHVQDFEVDAAIEMKMLPKMLQPMALWFEQIILRRFDRVSTISENMRERLLSKGVDAKKVRLFPNWVDVQRIYPLDRPSEMRQELGLSDDQMVALYSGNMGAKQGIETIVQVAHLLQDTPNIQFVLCGEGAVKTKLVHMAQELLNIRFLPLQPFDRLNELLNLADIHLLPQLANTADLIMPSKLTGMLASGRPIVATVAPHTQIAGVVKSCGTVVAPGDEEALKAAILSYANNRDLRIQKGKAARHLAMEIDRQKVLQEAWE